MVKVRRRVLKPTAMPSTARASDGSKLLFTPGHVPPPAEWMDSLQSLNDKELTAMECVNAAQRYVAVATPEESKWRGDLETSRLLQDTCCPTGHGMFVIEEGKSQGNELSNTGR